MGRFHRAARGLDHLERLNRADSPVHRLRPEAKLFVTLLYVVLVVSMPNAALAGLFPFVLYPALLIPLAGIPCKAIFSRLLVAMPFAFAGALANLAIMREPLFTLGAFTVTNGMLSFSSIILKTALSVSAVLILIAATPFAVIAESLTRPRLFRVMGLQLALTYRYTGALLSQAQDMWTAYALRSPGAKAIRMADAGVFLGQLLLRSFDRAERVYAAMLCRGFHGVYYGPPRRPAGMPDRVFVAAWTVALGVFRAFNLSALAGALFV